MITIPKSHDYLCVQNSKKYDNLSNDVLKSELIFIHHTLPKKRKTRTNELITEKERLVRLYKVQIYTNHKYRMQSVRNHKSNRLQGNLLQQQIT